MNRTSPESIVRQHYEFIARRDRDGVLSTLSEEIDWRFPGPKEIPFAGHRVGHAAVAEFFTAIGETVEIKEFRIDELIPRGNKVVVFGFERFLVTATGKEWAVNWVHIHIVENGKIRMFSEYTDTAAISAAYSV